MSVPGAAVNEPNQQSQDNQDPGTVAQDNQAPGTATPSSGIGDAASHPGQFPVPGTPPSDPMQVLMQAVLSQTKGLQQVVDKMSNPSSTAWSQSGESWGKSLDTKEMLRCDNYRGEKELFPSREKQFYGTLTLDMINLAWSPILKDIGETQLDFLKEKKIK